MNPTQPLEITNFSQGITDYFVDGNPMAAKVMDNVVLTNNGKFETRPGCVCKNNEQLPLGNFRVNKLAQLQKVLFGFQDKRLYRDNTGSWPEVLGPSSGTFLPGGDGNSIIIDTEWRKHLLFTSDAFISPQKLFVDSLGNYNVRNCGLPEIPAGVIFGSLVGTGSSYLYALIFSYTYTVGTVTYLDRGPVFYGPSQITGGAINGGNTLNITLPTTLAIPENWDVANLKIEIYRTLDAGDVYYRLGQVNFGTSAYVDNTTDLALQSNESLYVTGGISSNETPPKAKYVHAVNDYAYWAHYEENGEILSTSVLQSKAGDPDSVPRAFYADTEQPITGLSSIYDRPIVLCENYIYRIDNFFSDDGTGGTLLRRLDDKAGCISALSIVQTHLGLFWAGTQGFYWSDGFRVVNISPHLNNTYKKITQTDLRKARITGSFDSNNHRVYWAVNNDGNTDENNQMFVLDLRFPFIPDASNIGGRFTTASGGEIEEDSFRPTALISIGDNLYRGDIRGYILAHNQQYLNDLKIDITAPPSTWKKLTIEYTYASCLLDFGSKFYRKWVPRILISADNTTNLSLGIFSSNDGDRISGELKPIRYTNRLTWGNTLPVWGDPTVIWNIQGLIEEWRRFPAGGLRCNYKQITLKNANVQIINSNLLGQASVNNSLKTATLGGAFTWIPDIVDYFISFPHDNYTEQYKVLSASTNTLVYEDADNTGPATSGLYSWIISGKPKDEKLRINGYVIHWAMISKSHTPFSSSSLGGTP